MALSQRHCTWQQWAQMSVSVACSASEKAIRSRVLAQAHLQPPSCKCCIRASSPTACTVALRSPLLYLSALNLLLLNFRTSSCMLVLRFSSPPSPAVAPVPLTYTHVVRHRMSSPVSQNCHAGVLFTTQYSLRVETTSIFSSATFDKIFSNSIILNVLSPVLSILLSWGSITWSSCDPRWNGFTSSWGWKNSSSPLGSKTLSTTEAQRPPAASLFDNAGPPSCRRVQSVARDPYSWRSWLLTFSTSVLFYFYSHFISSSTSQYN